MVLASLISLAVHSLLTQPDIAAWGWRIGFLFGGVTGLGSYLLQRSLEETPEFKEMKKTASAARRPFAEVFQSHTGAVIAGTAALAVVGGFNGYLKFVTQDALDAYALKGITLTTLDGQPVTKAGWYDFTQRAPGQDGARFIDKNGDGFIDFIALTLRQMLEHVSRLVIVQVHQDGRHDLGVFVT